MKVDHFYIDEHDLTVWTYLINKGRGCWYAHEFDDLNVVSPFYALPPEEGIKAVLEIIQKNGFDPAKLPRIEDVDPLVKELYDNVSQSENYMWFVEPEDVDEETISREEYESRIDDAIRKYNLENVIVKNENGSLYTCYSGLQSMFSEVAH